MSEQTQALKHLNAYLDAIDEIATIGAAPKEHTGQAVDAAQIVAWRKWADNAEAQIASLTAQLDQKTAEVEMLRGVGCNEDGDGPCGACLKCARAERDAAQQEAQTLRVALVELVDATDDADNARDQGVSSSDAVMTRARAALAPRPQEPQ